MQINWELLYSDLNTAREKDALSWRTLADNWSVPPSTFTRIKQGKAVRSETLLMILGKIGQVASRYVAKGKRAVK